MLGEARLAETAQKVIGLSDADHIEVSLRCSESYLTRYGENEIHQNVAQEDAVLRIRSIFGERTSVVQGNDLSDAGLKKLLQAAANVVDSGVGGKGGSLLPGKASIDPVNSYSERTAHFSPLERAEGVESILRIARKMNLQAGGSFSTEVNESLIVNSNGVHAYHCGTLASLLTVAMSEDSSGFSSAVSVQVDDLDPAKVGQEAIEKALAGRRPQTMEPGEYTVVLEEAAVADLVGFLASMGMNARAMQEGRSFMEGRLGERVAGEAITIWDDGHDLRGIPVPFDGEGVPKKKVMLIENGIAKAVVYDTRTAARETGATSTGHALSAPSPYGPAARHLFMAPGTATKEEMISSTRRGILVSRFHYTNALHPKKTVITGMTRDGTFMIENGRISHPVEDLRFTQSILEALSHVEALGCDARLVKNVWAPIGTHAPAAKIQGFRFTGTRSSSGNGGNSHA